MRAAWRRNSEGARAYKVYQCGGCHGLTLPAEWADSVVTREVIERVEQWQEMLPQTAEESIDVEGLKLRVKALESIKEELVEDRSLGILTREQLRTGLAAADAEIAKIIDQLTAHISRGDGPWFWDTEALWAWSEDGDGNVDVERFTPVVMRVCKSITMTGPGKGRNDRRYGEHLVIEFNEMGA
ncbi:hypothetical protein GCM10022215_06100 [Nocardioides fonticola]|uniref:Recombinase zinc beta ribbon domain-containing protein n=1 Tax=Nocardioides fonticola TaxID=450363 RepID=A0ABP7XC29_9ACTN